MGDTDEGGHPIPGDASPAWLPPEQTEQVAPNGSLLRERHRLRATTKESVPVAG